jgi:hypothetical protein
MALAKGAWADEEAPGAGRTADATAPAPGSTHALHGR